MEKRYIFVVSIIAILVILMSMIGLGSAIYSFFLKKSPGSVLVLPDNEDSTNILFLHHSTGMNIWDGGVEQWFEDHNTSNNSKYDVYEQNFPKIRPYGWNNYPYDYWNIWINHEGKDSYQREPSLELITKHYDVVILKHCFPVSSIEEENGDPDIGSNVKTISNYKLQYEELLKKFQEFNNTKFIVWTTPALVESNTNEDEALRTREFNEWLIDHWDEPGDNVFLWDFYQLETEGGLYLKEENARDPNNSHPNEQFSRRVSPLFCKRIIDVIEGRGDTSSLTGE